MRAAPACALCMRPLPEHLFVTSTRLSIEVVSRSTLNSFAPPPQRDSCPRSVRLRPAAVSRPHVGVEGYRHSARARGACRRRLLPRLRDGEDVDAHAHRRVGERGAALLRRRRRRRGHLVHRARAV
eukprot:6178137-Pleurochrysis_carterae.AAC.1